MLLVDVPGQAAFREAVTAVHRVDPKLRVLCSFRLADLRQADMVMIVTSWPGYEVQPAHLKPGAIVIDDTYPHNLEPTVVDDRPDVLALDGRLVALPAEAQVSCARDLPPLVGVPLDRMTRCREVIACFGETLALTAIGEAEHFGVGRLDAAAARRRVEAGAELGFAPAPLQFYGELVSEDRMRRVAEAGEGQPTARSPLSASTGALASPFETS